MNGGIGFGAEIRDGLDQPSSPTSSSSSSTPAKITAVNSPPRFSVGAGGRSYIEHTVTKFDTLAGVAIKYGVEVADIKRINGLVSDLQMFALKTLQIPCPGRHPPSPNLSNGLGSQGPSSSEDNHSTRRHSDLFDAFPSLRLTPSPQRRVSPAMSSLQGFYGLKNSEQKSEGCEMAVYRKGGSHYLEDGPFGKPSGALNPPLSLHRKSKSVANGFATENGHLGDNGQESTDSDSDNLIDKLLVRRRQKSEADFNARTPELLLKEDNGSSGSGFLATKGKGLALRPKSASRTLSGADAEAGLPAPIPTGMGDSFVIDSVSVVRKSSSTSSLQDSESNGLSSLWPTSKWSLKPDLQALSNAVITRPIFDGLPKPITGRKNKAALD
ncbi:OLC1v1033245C1 [Oldenlandia corymbosa var. corymbosa]|uniref:OLC1v1033245C1 n=1 Tax=Oldenlandia corymbosa var. corymbosa TaxID=529605 RepID=A0AAV1CMZ3_OLDCO|nr:OLC1v1033245C1 [Oldenlandia corymbosa var. corymbosa]